MQAYNKHKVDQAKLSQENVDRFIANGGKINVLNGCKLTERTAEFNKSDGNKKRAGF